MLLLGADKWTPLEFIDKTLTARSSIVVDSFSKLLLTYSVGTVFHVCRTSAILAVERWDYSPVHWMGAIQTDIRKSELNRGKILLVSARNRILLFAILPIAVVLVEALHTIRSGRIFSFSKLPSDRRLHTS